MKDKQKKYNWIFLAKGLIHALLTMFIMLLLWTWTLPDSELNQGKVDFEEDVLKYFESPKVQSIKDQEEELWNKIKGIEVTETPVVQDEKPVDIQFLIPKGIKFILNRELKLKKPLNVLLIGDSMMLEGFGPVFERELEAQNGLTVTRVGKYSSGLNRSIKIDWYAETPKLLEKYKPEVAFILFGANDGQAIFDSSGRKYNLSSNQWDIIYAQKVNTYMQILSPKVKTVYWIGQPIPEPPDFQAKFKRMNTIYEAEAQKFDNVIFINSWDRFAINGKFAPVVKNDAGLAGVVKHSDGIHLTTHGSKILSKLVIDRFKKDIE